MSFHRITLIVDDEWLAAIGRVTEWVESGEMCTWITCDPLLTIPCPTCGAETLEDDLIPCTLCTTPLCYRCQEDSNYPCTGTERS